MDKFCISIHRQPTQKDCEYNTDFRWNLVAGTTMITAVILAPITWQMWIITGSGNANFYFAATISYSIAQVLTTSCLSFKLLGHNPLTHAFYCEVYCIFV